MPTSIKIDCTKSLAFLNNYYKLMQNISYFRTAIVNSTLFPA